MHALKIRKVFGFFFLVLLGVTAPAPGGGLQRPASRKMTKGVKGDAFQAKWKSGGSRKHEGQSRSLQYVFGDYWDRLLVGRKVRDLRETGARAASDNLAGAAGGIVEGCNLCSDCEVGRIACGEVQHGVLPLSRCLFFGDSPVHVWNFTATEAGRFRFTLESGEFDPFLVLLDEDCAPFDDNDDCSPDTVSSCLASDLPAGTYYLGVQDSAGGAGGSYDAKSHIAWECRSQITWLCGGDISVVDGHGAGGSEGVVVRVS